jgi:hypothetical protein
VLRHQPPQTTCILIALEMDLLRPIVDAQGKPIIADEVAAVARSNNLLTVRTLLMLSALAIVTETGRKTYVSDPSTIHVYRLSRIGA